jgi:hypothetical protein
MFRDAEADKAHSESAAVKTFSSSLYLECLAPVEFVNYQLVASRSGQTPADVITGAKMRYYSDSNYQPSAQP